VSGDLILAGFRIDDSGRLEAAACQPDQLLALVRTQHAPQDSHERALLAQQHRNFAVMGAQYIPAGQSRRLLKVRASGMREQDLIELGATRESLSHGVDQSTGLASIDVQHRHLSDDLLYLAAARQVVLDPAAELES
jgi:hypothetical protein